MRWYNGGIVEAISTSKKNGAIFVVYIEGKDEESSQITTLIEKDELTAKLESNNFVAIKIEADSVPHQQFSEIYKQATVPSLFFIGKSGAPLEIVTKAGSVSELSEKIDDVLVKGGYSTKTNSALSSESFIKSELQGQQPSSPPPNVVCENGVCKIQDGPASSTSSPASPAASSSVTSSPDTSAPKSPDHSSSPELTVEEKVERAKELLEKQRLLKQKEEEENERLKEIERRKAGQNVQNLKKWQEDQELKQLKEDREKEKRENQAARDRVLAQIAQDKAERAAKFSSSPPKSVSSPQPSSSASSPRPASSNTHTARLQFKLPDGSSHTQDFPSHDSLQKVHLFIKENLNLSFNKYTLSTTFPRREFTENDASQSLLDLQLVPNAVILVLPINNGTVSTNQGGGLTAMFWSLIAPFLNIFSYLRAFVFGSSSTTSSSSQKRPAEATSERNRPTPPSKRRSGESVVKRQGNIHRLSSKKDSDDENNTWNGNSTQQM